MRWKAFFFDIEEEAPKAKQTFGFPTEKTPPIIPALTAFENEMYDVVQNVKFKNFNPPFSSNFNATSRK